jgi:DNA-directed RNA polymerase subunit RPC12/RpoP
MSRSYARAEVETRKPIYQRQTVTKKKAQRCTMQEAKDYRCKRLKAVLYTDATCPECGNHLSVKEVKLGWSRSETDVTTACPDCGYRFVAKLIPAYSQEQKYDVLPFWCPVQTKACFRLMWIKTPPILFTLSKIVELHPKLYWNLCCNFKNNGQTMDDVFNSMCLVMTRDHIEQTDLYREMKEDDTETDEHEVKTKSHGLPPHFVPIKPTVFDFDESDDESSDAEKDGMTRTAPHLPVIPTDGKDTATSDESGDESGDESWDGSGDDNPEFPVAASQPPTDIKTQIVDHTDQVANHQQIEAVTGGLLSEPATDLDDLLARAEFEHGTPGRKRARGDKHNTHEVGRPLETKHKRRKTLIIKAGDD